MVTEHFGSEQELTWVILTKLTRGQGGRMGHVVMACPESPQYKQRPWVSQCRRSAIGSRVDSSCIGSDSGELAGSSCWITRGWCWELSLHPCIRWASCMNLSRLMVSLYAARCSQNCGGNPWQNAMRREYSFHPLTAANVQNFKAYSETDIFPWCRWYNWSLMEKSPMGLPKTLQNWAAKLSRDCVTSPNCYQII